MIVIETLDSKIWNLDQKIIEIIREYTSNGNAVISFNHEGPCCRTNKFYSILDSVCESFGFDKSKIMIKTCNAEEHHSEYTIIINDTIHWAPRTTREAQGLGIAATSLKDKCVTENLFALFVNRPNWARLCLLSHLAFNIDHRAIVTCNPSWNQNAYNAVHLDEVIKYSHTELPLVQKFLDYPTIKLRDAELDKDNFRTNVTALRHYNNFFIEVVCETYTSGNTFFPTEKTFRPMYGLTPFITFGPQGFLSNLRARYGFKTFSKWWDESYDECQNYDRVKKIYQLIDYIDSKHDVEIIDMYKDMAGVLEHNFNILQELND